VFIGQKPKKPKRNIKNLKLETFLLKNLVFSVHVINSKFVKLLLFFTSNYMKL